MQDQNRFPYSDDNSRRKPSLHCSLAFPKVAQTVITRIAFTETMESKQCSNYYLGPSQTAAPQSPLKQQPRQTVCWSNASLPDANDHGTVDSGNTPEREPTTKATPTSNIDTASSAWRYHSGKFRQSFRSNKRRLIQQILVKLNHAEPSSDAEYLALRARQLDLHDHLAAVTTHIKSFATNLVALGHGASLIGDASLQIASSATRSIPSSRAVCSFTKTTTNQSEPHFNGSHACTAFDSDFPKSMVKVETHARGLAVRASRIWYFILGIWGDH